MTQASFAHEGAAIDYTPTADVSAEMWWYRET